MPAQHDALISQPPFPCFPTPLSSFPCSFAPSPPPSPFAQFVLGGLFKIHARNLIIDAPKNTADSMDKVAQNCFIAAAIYIGTAAISGWQLWANRRQAARIQAERH